MDALSMLMGQLESGNAGESYTTKMDQLRQQQQLMEQLRNGAMAHQGETTQTPSQGNYGRFGATPTMVQAPSTGSFLGNMLASGLGQYGANQAGKGIAGLAGKNDQAYADILRAGGNPQGDTPGNFPQALPPQPVEQGALSLGNPSIVPSGNSPGISGGKVQGVAATPPEMRLLKSLKAAGYSDKDTAAALQAQYGSKPEVPAPTPAAPEVADATNASIPASGQLEAEKPVLSKREEWMLGMSHAFPQSAASMNSMLQAESNTRRDLENQPLKMALAEMRINQAADSAASRAQSQKELQEIKAAQAAELENLRQGNRIDLKKTPPAAAPPKPSLNAQGGSAAFTNTLSMMREMYAKLDRSKGITNTDNTPVQNVKAWAMSSGPGQILSQALGTKDQSARNSINQSRPLLVRGIAEATGMPSKSIDSNAELKLWLDAASSPSADIGANMRALKNIEDWVNYKRAGVSTAPAAPTGKTVVREVKLIDGRTGVEYSDGSKGYK